MTKPIVAFSNFANAPKSNSIFVINMCHIFVQDGGKHAEILVHATNSDRRKACSSAVGNGTSRDSNAAAALTLFSYLFCTM